MSKCYFAVDGSGNQPFIPQMSINDGESVNQAGLSRKHIIDAVGKSVQRLGTYIDVLQIHRLDETPVEEITDALHDLVAGGSVRYLGASTVCMEVLYLGAELTELRCTLQNFKSYKARPRADASPLSSVCSAITISSTGRRRGR